MGTFYHLATAMLLLQCSWLATSEHHHKAAIGQLLKTSLLDKENLNREAEEKIKGIIAWVLRPLAWLSFILASTAFTSYVIKCL